MYNIHNYAISIYYAVKANLSGVSWTCDQAETALLKTINTSPTWPLPSWCCKRSINLWTINPPTSPLPLPQGHYPSEGWELNPSTVYKIIRGWFLRSSESLCFIRFWSRYSLEREWLSAASTGEFVLPDIAAPKQSQPGFFFLHTKLPLDQSLAYLMAGLSFYRLNCCGRSWKLVLWLVCCSPARKMDLLQFQHAALYSKS